MPPLLVSEIASRAYQNRRYIGVAVAATLVLRQLVKYYLAYRVPPKLRHIPAISTWRVWKSLLTNEPLTERTRRLVYPTLPKANGFYLVRFPFDWTIYVANPVLARTVLFKPEFADKSRELVDQIHPENGLSLFIGTDNVAFVNGKEWKEQRKIMNPAFHRSAPVATFGALAVKAFALIESQGTVKVVELIQRMTLDALGKAIFDFDFKGLEDPDAVWVKEYNLMFEGLMELFPALYPKLAGLYRMLNPKSRARYKATYKLVKLLDEVAEDRREKLAKAPFSSKPDHEKDLLTLMLEAEMRGEGTWSKQELRHNMGIFFLAGHDTTSHAISFCLYSLAVNQDVQKKARREALDLFGDAPVDVFPTLQDIKKFEYLDMVIKETLRMYPPGNDIVPRNVMKDVELGGVLIPKGSMINVDIHALHHDPALWHDPETFDPERFRPGGEHSHHEGVAYAPFSSGSRQCIGLNFAMMQQRIFLAMLLRKFEWELAANSEHQNGLKFSLPANMAPKSLELTFHKRY
ncbi:cytochrome P450 [Dichotomocladium elegans]|nr:cytochrome P450 [Dichotomocladium elegans]